MKRILYVDLSSGYGGSSEVLYNYLRCSDKKKFLPIVLVARDGQNFDKIKKLNIEVIRSDIKVLGMGLPSDGRRSYVRLFLDLLVNFVPNVIKISKVIRKNKIDLVQVNTNIKNNIDVIFAAKVTRRPCICYERETRPKVKIERIFARFIDAVIVLNQREVENMKKIVKSDKIRLIYDGLDLSIHIDKGNVEKIRDMYCLHDHICAGILGRFVDGKGQDDFIRAASIVCREHKNVKFLVVGDNPDQGKEYGQKLRAMVDQLGLRDKVLFTGWRNDKFDIISALDIIVQATSTFPEGFGLTCIEGMALSKAVVATNIAGPSQIVQDGITGYLVDPGQPSQLAEAMIKLIESPQTLCKFGEAGRKRVEEMFTIQNNVREVELLYEQLTR